MICPKCNKQTNRLSTKQYKGMFVTMCVSCWQKEEPKPKAGFGVIGNKTGGKWG